MILRKIDNVQPEQKPTNDSTADNSQVAPAIGNTNVIGGFVWKRTGSFLDQIKDVWKLSLNDKVVSIVTVDTINYCTIKIHGETYKTVHGIEDAKKYVISIINKI